MKDDEHDIIFIKDEFEEGYFVPVLNYAVDNFKLKNETVCTYTRIGNNISVTCRIEIHETGYLETLPLPGVLKEINFKKRIKNKLRKIFKIW